VSYSWVDPHFAALYARREEERLAERLAAHVRAVAACEPDLERVCWRGPGWMEQDVKPHGHLRLL
jgi:hypothetical protein